MTDKAKKAEWLQTAQSFFNAGEFGSMRACAREILINDLEDPDGLALLAQASLYLGERKTALRLCHQVEQSKPSHLRNLLVLGELARSEHRLRESVRILGRLWRAGCNRADGLTGPDLAVLERAGRLIADGCVLLAEPEQASELLFELSAMLTDEEERADLYSKALFLSNFTRRAPQQSLKLHKGYNRFFQGRELLPQRPPVPQEKRGKLRIGYLTADLRQHSMANLLTPFLRDYSKLEYNVYVYMAGEADKVTKRFKRYAAIWRDVSQLSALETAQQIYEDRIDILVDFTGHSQHSCLPVLAYKPAPVQMSGLGYINTTGLKAVDWFLSDYVCLPQTEVAGFTERVARLPHQLCYIPIAELPPPVTRPPSLNKGYITFGSFNDFAKVSHETLLLWRAVLEAVPDSRLFVKGRIASLLDGREAALARFKSVGIDTDRVVLSPFAEDYLRTYGEVDIALDTTPYTGGITTCEALMMGVPVITLQGTTHGSCFSSSVLMAAGLPELVAANEMDYVNKAVQLAMSPELLCQLHAGLRKELFASALMDGPGYMREMERLYRNLWADYLASQ